MNNIKKALCTIGLAGIIIASNAQTPKIKNNVNIEEQSTQNHSIPEIVKINQNYNVTSDIKHQYDALFNVVKDYYKSNSRQINQNPNTNRDIMHKLLEEPTGSSLDKQDIENAFAGWVYGPKDPSCSCPTKTITKEHVIKAMFEFYILSKDHAF